jgi:hypothetical protein
MVRLIKSFDLKNGDDDKPLTFSLSLKDFVQNFDQSKNASEVLKMP